MVIKFSKEEITELGNIMETAEPGSLNTYKELLKDTNLVKFRIHPVEKSVEVIINNDYSVEFLQVYTKFVGLFVSQTRALFETMQLFTVESQAVVDKYMENNESC